MRGTFRKKGDDAVMSTMMSEAETRVAACIANGRLMPRLKDQTLSQLRQMVGKMVGPLR